MAKGTLNYRQSSNISRTLVGNILVYESDVVGASPVGPHFTCCKIVLFYLMSHFAHAQSHQRITFPSLLQYRNFFGNLPESFFSEEEGDDRRLRLT